MSPVDTATLLRKFVHEPWEDGNLDSLDQVVADGYVLDDHHTLDDLKDAIRSTRQGLPDLKVTIDDVVSEGNKVAWRFTMRGTHTGDLEGQAPTGKQVTLSGITIVHLENDNVAADWFGPRGSSIAEQLGATT